MSELLYLLLVTQILSSTYLVFLIIITPTISVLTIICIIYGVIVFTNTSLFSLFNF